MIKVSVIVPVYNSERYLKICIDSIINQTMENLELICVNDGSTDNSLSILDEYRKNDNRVKIINKINGGSASARNVGLSKASGEYIYFVDNDDYIDLSTLEIYCKYADKYKLDVVYSNPKWECDTDDMIDPYSKTKDPEGDQLKIQNGKELMTSLILRSNYYAAPWKRFIRKSFLDSISCKFLESASPHEDNLFSFIIDIEAGKVLFIKDRLYTHRSHAASTMITNQNKKNLGPKVVSHFLCGIGIFQYSFNRELNDDTQLAISRRINGLINRAFQLFNESDGDPRKLNWNGHWLEQNMFMQLYRYKQERDTKHQKVFVNDVTIEKPLKKKKIILFFLPYGSLRRRVVKILFHLVFHPVKSCRKIIKRFKN